MIYESDYIWKIGPASQDLIEVPRETLQKAALKFRDLAVIGNRILKYLKNKRYVEEKFFGLIKKRNDSMGALLGRVSGLLCWARCSPDGDA